MPTMTPAAAAPKMPITTFDVEFMVVKNLKW
jgi:hypothetical protein